MTPTWGRALVTGASRGIGEALARHLAAEGTDLVLVALERGRLEALAAELTDRHGVTVEVLCADLGQKGPLGEVEERLSDPRSVIDLLVNNAGFATAGPFIDLDADDEEREVMVNCRAVLRLCHAAAPGMAARGTGAILNVSSLSYRATALHNSTYAATKAFVSHLSEGLHEELRGTGVTVTVVEPGLTRTEFHDRMIRVSPPDRERPETGRRAGLRARLWQTADQVAVVALAATRDGRPVVVSGAHNRLASGLSALIPRTLRRRAVAWVSRRT